MLIRHIILFGCNVKMVVAMVMETDKMLHR